MGESIVRDNVVVNCSECGEMTEHELVIETFICEEWKCKICDNTRLFGK